MPTSEPIAAAHGRSGSDLDILLVEDNQVYAAWLSGLVRQESDQRGRQVRIFVVASLAEAKNMLAIRRIDALLLDLNLPDTTGLSTVSEMTAICPNLPIVVVSAMEDEDIAIKALSLGAQEYIFKGREREGSVFRVMCRSMERKNVELQLALAQQQAMHNERMAAIGMMASGVAHEYNNIGAVILGNVELLLRNAALPQTLRPRVERIRDAADRAAAVTQGLLSYVRGFRETEQTVVMQDVIRSTWSLAESSLIRYLVSGEITMPSLPLSVRGNPSILGQILLNMIINACHAMEGLPRKQLQVLLKADQDGTGVLLSVADTGRGIAPENLDKIFLPFFSTKNTKGTAVTGTGLGLAVCDAFVRQHGGTIRVESKLDSGTTFEVWLPLVMSSTVKTPEIPLPPMALEVEGLTALIIDDEDGVRDVFDLALRDLGMVTTLKSSLVGVIQLLQTALPDLVLTDWQLPEMSGRVLVEHLQTIPLTQRPVILVSSGNLLPEDRQWLEGLPGVTIVDKPVALRDLQMLVRQALAQRHRG
jgi:two-component system, cell cycle sensor histidine kinase and response regulator CckA